MEHTPAWLINSFELRDRGEQGRQQFEEQMAQERALTVDNAASAPATADNLQPGL